MVPGVRLSKNRNRKKNKVTKMKRMDKKDLLLKGWLYIAKLAANIDGFADKMVEQEVEDKEEAEQMKKDLQRLCKIIINQKFDLLYGMPSPFVCVDPVNNKLVSDTYKQVSEINIDSIEDILLESLDLDKAFPNLFLFLFTARACEIKEENFLIKGVHYEK